MYQGSIVFVHFLLAYILVRVECIKLGLDMCSKVFNFSAMVGGGGDATLVLIFL